MTDGIIPYSLICRKIIFGYDLVFLCVVVVVVVVTFFDIYTV